MSINHKDLFKGQSFTHYLVYTWPDQTSSSLSDIRDGLGRHVEYRSNDNTFVALFASVYDLAVDTAVLEALLARRRRPIEFVKLDLESIPSESLIKTLERFEQRWDDLHANGWTRSSSSGLCLTSQAA